MMPSMRRWVFALTLAAVTASCGPIAYINQVTRDASTKVDRARSLEAEKYSPYWWTRAVTYLRMAREVAAHADFQGANRFGRLSAESAEKAAAEAEVIRKDPSKAPVNPNVGPAPAKEEDEPEAAPAK
jgi:hypothetical protein